MSILNVILIITGMACAICSLVVGLSASNAITINKTSVTRSFQLSLIMSLTFFTLAMLVKLSPNISSFFNQQDQCQQKNPPFWCNLDQS